MHDPVIVTVCALYLLLLAPSTGVLVYGWMRQDGFPSFAARLPAAAFRLGLAAASGLLWPLVWLAVVLAVLIEVIQDAG